MKLSLILLVLLVGCASQAPAPTPNVGATHQADCAATPPGSIYVVSSDAILSGSAIVYARCNGGDVAYNVLCDKDGKDGFMGSTEEAACLFATDGASRVHVETRCGPPGLPIGATVGGNAVKQ